MTVDITKQPAGTATEENPGARCPGVSENPRWDVRFGQVFQAFLKETGKLLEDYYYLLPSGVILNPRDAGDYSRIDLRIDGELYNRHFSGNIPPVASFDRALPGRLDAALVIVPGFGHHLLIQKSFGEQFPLLEQNGFEVVYADYPRSFRGNDACNRSVCELLRRAVDPDRRLVFLTYSKGSPMIADLLADPRYADIAGRTRAMISLAGALRGSVLASDGMSRAVKRFLRACRREASEHTVLARLVAGMVKALSLSPLGEFKEWNTILRKVRAFSGDLCDIPAGITDLTRDTLRREWRHRQIPPSVKCLSLAAVFPESAFEKNLEFFSNPDDMFLFLSGRGLYRKNAFNDCQVMLPDARYFEGTCDPTDLGMLKTHHWGVTVSGVLSQSHRNAFPRTELLKAILVFLDEFLQRDNETARKTRAS